MRTMDQLRGDRVAAPGTAPARITVRLLGCFEVRVGADAVGLPASAQRVVAYLALHRDPVSRVQVAGTLWAESAEERAGASLRSALWRLGLPGCALVRATPQTLALAPDAAVDLHLAICRAHRLIGWDEADARPGDPAEERRNWQALSGQLLPGWYDEWAIIERERFNQLRLHALEALCRSLTAQGRFGPAVEAGHAAVAADPLRESAHRVLAQAFLAEGNRSDALHQFRLYHTLCREELGCDPSAQFAGLVGLPAT
ncbi:MAG TPA: BTAD domain-containing putative transcriptional regulator [Actinomycetota bacterium]|nr:BTAD domain-containing putative transcriptional regulator [Actinomycetota bacterium]